jgi:UDP-3-O-[3-hydroxymyristoyl] glucosamine N-acyltransferase
MTITASEIAAKLQGEVLGDGSLSLTGFASADRAQPGELTFAENETYFARAEASAASAILAGGDFKSAGKVVIRVPNVRVAFAKVLPLFFAEPVFAPGTHPTAIVAGSAQIDPTAHIGPFCVVGDGVRLGPRVVLQAFNHIGPDSSLGEDSNLFPNVTVYSRSQIGKRVRIHSGTVIGSDGFGYVFDEGIHRKVPQVGNVIIGDDVEIGANVTVDRGALGPTTIGKGTKIDNLVQVAHNVIIGEHCLLVSQVGIAGSTRLGNYVTLGGQVGLAGHLKIGNQVVVAAQAGVMRDAPDGTKWLGSPAYPDRDAKRQYIAIQQLPALIRRVRELEERLARLSPPDTRPS